MQQTHFFPDSTDRPLWAWAQQDKLRTKAVLSQALLASSSCHLEPGQCTPSPLGSSLSSDTDTAVHSQQHNLAHLPPAKGPTPLFSPVFIFTA